MFQIALIDIFPCLVYILLVFRISRKDLETFPAVYSRSVEDGWYDWWKDKGMFASNPGTRERKVMFMPKKIVYPPPGESFSLGGI